MRWSPLASCALLALCAALVGCTADAPGAVAAPLEDELTLRVIASPPTGGDGPSTVSVVWRGAALAFDPPAIAAVRWNHALVVTDRAGTAWQVGADGVRARLAVDVAVPPIASDDGRALALVRRGGDGDARLVVAEDGVVRQVARGLGACGPLRFSPQRDALVFVAPSAGGVAGLHAIALRRPAEPVCLTNCGLRTGGPWGEGFVPTPPAEALRFSPQRDAVTWDGGPQLSLGGAR